MMFTRPVQIKRLACREDKRTTLQFKAKYFGTFRLTAETRRRFIAEYLSILLTSPGLRYKLHVDAVLERWKAYLAGAAAYGRSICRRPR